jgi:hypothetical protein
MYAFVDPDRMRVTFIGFTIRQGIVSSNVTCVKTTDGVLISENDPAIGKTKEIMANVTIIDTGYDPSVNLTDTQREAFTAIALDDSRVKHYLDGFEYQVELNGSYWWKADAPRNYIIYYPSVHFLIKDVNQSWSSFIRADVDPRSGKVVEFQAPSGLIKYR